MWKNATDERVYLLGGRMVFLLWVRDDSAASCGNHEIRRVEMCLASFLSLSLCDFPVIGPIGSVFVNAHLWKHLLPALGVICPYLPP